MTTTSCCQSCAIPMETMAPGTEADGSPNPDYCQLCYADGAFTADMTMEQMAEAWASYLSQAGAPTAGEDEYPLPAVVTDPNSAAIAGARRDLLGLLPTLKRWRKAE